MGTTATSHLDEAARRALDFDDAHRIALIDRDIWIGYGRARAKRMPGWSVSCDRNGACGRTMFWS